MLLRWTYVNIGDMFYRYKMPALNYTIEGKRNGTKTRIRNIESIAYALTRSCHTIMKYFSIYFGTSIQNQTVLREESHYG